MKWSPILHGIAALSGIAGAVALIVAWVVRENGELFGLSQEHFFTDAQLLFLASIAFGIGTLIHMKLEKR